VIGFDPAGNDGARLRRAQGLAAAEARRPRRCPLHGGTVDASRWFAVVHGAAQWTPVAKPPVEKKVAYFPSLTGKMSDKASAPATTHRGSRKPAFSAASVTSIINARPSRILSGTTRTQQSKALLRIFEKTTAVHVAERDQLLKELVDRG
jgi:hypothetical protein